MIASTDLPDMFTSILNKVTGTFSAQRPSFRRFTTAKSDDLIYRKHSNISKTFKFGRQADSTAKPKNLFLRIGLIILWFGLFGGTKVAHSLCKPAGREGVHDPLRVVAFGEVPLQEGRDVCRESVFLDGLAHLPHEGHHLVDVMDGEQRATHFLSTRHSGQECAGVVFARVAAAIGVNGLKVGCELLLLEGQETPGHDGGAKAGRSAWPHAVKHVYAHGHTHYQVQWVPHTHQIPVERLLTQEKISINLGLSRGSAEVH